MPHPPCYCIVIRIVETLPSHTSIAVNSQVLVLPNMLHDFLTQCLAYAFLSKSTLCLTALMDGFVAGEVFALSAVWFDWYSTPEVVGIDQVTHGVFQHLWAASTSHESCPWCQAMPATPLEWFSIVWEIQKSCSEAISQLGLSEVTSYKLKSSYGFWET